MTRTRIRNITVVLACLAVLSCFLAMVPRQVVRADEVSSTAATGVQKIVFTGEFSGTREIWMMNPDGTEMRQLTFHPGYNQQSPAVSPDGTKIAYSSNLDETDPNKDDVFVLDLISGTEQNLTKRQGRDDYPTWSPGGTEIVFQSDRDGGGVFSLWRVPASGGEATRVTDPRTATPLRDYDNQPQWVRTPDGDKVVFHSFLPGSGFSVWEMHLTEGQPVTDTPREIISKFGVRGEAQAKYSPDGTMITWSHGEGNPHWEIWVAKSDNVEGTKRQLTSCPLDADQEHILADWSPDGKTIVFNVETGAGHSIRMVNVADPLNVSEEIARGFCADWCVMPQPSEKIVFAGEFTGNREIWMMNPDGTNLEQITSHPGFNQQHPAVSPDGTQIAFTSNLDETDPNKEDVFVLDLVTRVETNLTAWQGRDSYPSWSPGGNEIVFDSDRQGPQSLWRVPAKGGEATRVTDPSADSPQRGYDNCPHWGRTPEGDKVVFHAWNADGTQASIYEIGLTEGNPVTDTPRRIIPWFGGRGELMPRYSPDGQSIAWVHETPGDRLDLWVADCSDPEGSKHQVMADPDGYYNTPDWSPDGTKLVHTMNSYSIRITDVNTNVKTGEIVGGMHPDWCVIPANRAPVMVSSVIGPELAYETTELTASGTASDADADALSYEYEWFVNGISTGQTGATLDGTYFNKGGSVYCSIRAFDGEAYSAWMLSNTVTIQNSTPAMAGATIAPDPAYETTLLTASGSASDANGDALTYQYEWFVNGMSTGQAGTTLGGTYFNKGDAVYCNIRAFDDEVYSGWMQSNTIVINNTPPVAYIDSVQQPEPDFILPVVHTLTFQGSLADPDPLDTHIATWDFGDGTIVSVPTSGNTTTVQHAYLQPDTYTITLTISDGVSTSDPVTVQVTVATTSEAIAILEQVIQDLPSDVFKNNADQRVNALMNKIDAIMSSLDSGAYQDAINKLLNDIRSKADGSLGGNPSNDWITDPEAQQQICSMIDDLVAYIRTLM